MLYELGLISLNNRWSLGLTGKEQNILNKERTFLMQKKSDKYQSSTC